MSSGRAGSPPDSKSRAGAPALISIPKSWAIGSATGCTNGAAANANGAPKGSVADDDCGEFSQRISRFTDGASLVNFCLVTELIFIKMCVDAALREQLLVRAALDDASVFEREDDVGLDDRFQVVSDDDDGLACGQASERFEHELFR